MSDSFNVLSAGKQLMIFRGIMDIKKVKLARTLSDGFISQIRKTLRIGQPDTKFQAIHKVYDQPINFASVDGVNLVVGESWTFLVTNQPESKENGVYTVRTVRPDER